MDEVRFFRALYTRVPRTPATITIVALCVLVYIAQTWRAGMAFSIPVAVLRDMGANFAPLVQSGQPWRLVSSIFLHGNPIHIAFNMLALWQIGQIAERLFGSLAFALIFLVTGVIGALASNWWAPLTVSVGASGAIFGVAGALLAYLFMCRGQMPMTVLRQTRGSMLAFVAYSLFAGAAVPGIDNAAHGGGLLAGLVVGAGFALPVTSRLFYCMVAPASLDGIGSGCCSRWVVVVERVGRCSRLSKAGSAILGCRCDGVRPVGRSSIEAACSATGQWGRCGGDGSRVARRCERIGTACRYHRPSRRSGRCRFVA
ncbi:MAG: rhomboid family intramembrane serine protease [Rhodocyclaceae bacterium]